MLNMGKKYQMKNVSSTLGVIPYAKVKFFYAT